MHLHLTCRLKEQVQLVPHLANMMKYGNETKTSVSLDRNFHSRPPPFLFFLLHKNLPRQRQQSSTYTQDKPQANSELLQNKTTLLIQALSLAGLWQLPLKVFLYANRENSLWAAGLQFCLLKGQDMMGEDNYKQTRLTAVDKAQASLYSSFPH